MVTYFALQSKTNVRLPLSVVYSCVIPRLTALWRSVKQKLLNSELLLEPLCFAATWFVFSLLARIEKSLALFSLVLVNFQNCVFGPFTNIRIRPNKAFVWLIFYYMNVLNLPHTVNVIKTRLQLRRRLYLHFRIKFN